MLQGRLQLAAGHRPSQLVQRSSSTAAMHMLRWRGQGSRAGCLCLCMQVARRAASHSCPLALGKPTRMTYMPANPPAQPQQRWPPPLHCRSIPLRLPSLPTRPLHLSCPPHLPASSSRTLGRCLLPQPLCGGNVVAVHANAARWLASRPRHQARDEAAESSLVEDAQFETKVVSRLLHDCAPAGHARPPAMRACSGRQWNQCTRQGDSS